MPSDPTGTPTDPKGRYVEGHQLLALTDQLNDAATYEAAAQATEHVLDPGDGVLVRLGQFFEDAFAALADLEEDLHATPGQLCSLGPETPSRQARTARSHTTAHQSPVAPNAHGGGCLPHARCPRAACSPHPLGGHL